MTKMIFKNEANQLELPIQKVMDSKKKIKYSWEESFPWLRREKRSNGKTFIYCDLCRITGQKAVYYGDICMTYKTDSLMKHGKTKVQETSKQYFMCESCPSQCCTTSFLWINKALFYLILECKRC